MYDLDAAENALTMVDKLSPSDWAQFSLSQQQDQLANLRGLLHLIDAAIVECDRIIMSHEVSSEHQAYIYAQTVRSGLNERTRRVQREATLLQSLIKQPL